MVLAVLQKGGVENLTDIANVKAASIFEQKLLRQVTTKFTDNNLGILDETDLSQGHFEIN